MQRKGSTHWQGNMHSGLGEISTESGALKSIPYAYSTRFENDPGTNPEELIAAAHSACFAMSLSGILAKKGYNADSLDVSAVVSIEKNSDGGFGIRSSKLRLRAQVPGIDKKTFYSLAEDAKLTCPVSKALKVEISLDIDFHQTLSASHGAHH